MLCRRCGVPAHCLYLPDAAHRAVALVREGRAANLMKGNLHTDVFLAEVVRKEGGLRVECGADIALNDVLEAYVREFKRRAP